MVWTCTREDRPGAGAPVGRMRSARRRQPQGCRAGRKDLSGRRLDRTTLNSATPSLTAGQLSRRSSANDVFPKIRRRQVCHGSWNSETFSYNRVERLGGNFLQSTLDSTRRRYTPLVCTDWPVGNSKKSGPAAVRRASAKRVETEMWFAGEPASGPVVVTRRALSGQAGLSGQRSCPRAWGFSPWVDTLMRVDAGHHRC